MAGQTQCHKNSWAICRFILAITPAVLLLGLVIAYVIMGAFVFEILESDNLDRQLNTAIKQEPALQWLERDEIAEKFWNKSMEVPLHNNKKRGNRTAEHSIIHSKKKWKRLIIRMFKDYQQNTTLTEEEENFFLPKKMRNKFEKLTSESKQNWIFYHFLTYSVSLITTMDYKTAPPKTDASALFTFFYVLIGVPLLGACLYQWSKLFARLLQKIYSSLRHCNCKECCKRDDSISIKAKVDDSGKYEPMTNNANLADPEAPLESEVQEEEEKKIDEEKKFEETKKENGESVKAELTPCLERQQNGAILVVSEDLEIEEDPQQFILGPFIMASIVLCLYIILMSITNVQMGMDYVLAFYTTIRNLTLVEIYFTGLYDDDLLILLLYYLFLFLGLILVGTEAYFFCLTCNKICKNIKTKCRHESRCSKCTK